MTKRYYLLIWALLFLLLIWGIYYRNFKNYKITGSILVNKQDNITIVKNQLCKKNLIKNCFIATIYTKLFGPSRILPWYYYFSWQTIDEVFKQLEKWPPIKYVKFTILPGDTKYDIASKLSENNNLKDIFLSLIENEKFIQKIKKEYPLLNKFWEIKSLEGFLYPDTYFFRSDDLSSPLFPQLLIKTAVKEFVNKTKSLNWNNPYNLTPYEVLIFASIVEKEEFANENKPLIADILIRRYKNNWKIWADWTLCYWLKITSDKCKDYLTYKYLTDKSNPYNTRANYWLPPSCVWNPTIDSIKAVLNPKKNNYWYYLHDKTWQIHFWKNEKEHILNKNKFLR